MAREFMPWQYAKNLLRHPDSERQRILDQHVDKRLHRQIWTHVRNFEALRQHHEQLERGVTPDFYED